METMRIILKHNIISMIAIGIILFLGGFVWGSDTPAKTNGIYDFLHRFHGHTCGGSLMGARLGLAAKAVLERLGRVGKLKAEYFDHSCPVDGIQVTAGTTYGNGAITVHDNGVHRLILTDTKSGNQVEAMLSKEAIEKGEATRELHKKYQTFPKESPERAKLEQEIDNIFDWLCTADESEVVTVKILGQ